MQMSNQNVGNLSSAIAVAIDMLPLHARKLVEKTSHEMYEFDEGFFA